MKSDADYIRSLRAKLKLTQVEFAALIGVDRRTVIRWETGKHPMLRGMRFEIEHKVSRWKQRRAR